MKNLSWARYIAVTLVLILSAGCASGNKFNYSDVIADLSASGAKAVGVATHDQRAYIKSGEKNPDFVGLMRGGLNFTFGAPHNVTTASGHPMAADMTRALASSLSKKGFKAVPIVVTQTDDQNAVLEKLKASGAERLVLLTLNEWKSDTYHNTALQYDVSLKVYDQAGNVLSEKKIQGKDDLGGTLWGDPVSFAEKAIPPAFKGKIEELLNNPSIANTLQ